MKKIYQSKTFWTGLATVATGFGCYFTGEQSLQELAMGLMGFVFIVLRVVTDTEIDRG